MSAAGLPALRRAVAEALGADGTRVPLGPLRPPEFPEIDLLLPLPAGALLVAIGPGEGLGALARGLAQRAWLSAWAGTFPGVPAGVVRLDVVAASFDPATRWAAASQPPGTVHLYRYLAAGEGIVLEGVPLPPCPAEEASLSPALLDREELLAFASYRPSFLHPDRHADA